MTPRNDLEQAAIHEAGHFVFAKLTAVGDDIELAVLPAPTGKAGKYIGHYKWRPCAMGRATLAEQRGTPIEEIVEAPGQGRYREGRQPFINQQIIVHLGGPAAAWALAGDDGTMSKSDYDQSCNAARMIMPDADVPAFLDRRMREVRDICAGPLRHTIFAVAERLISKRTFNAEELADLWEEVKPRAPEPDGRVAARSPWAAST